VTERLKLNLTSAAAATGRTLGVTATPPLPLCRSGSDAARLERAQRRSTARLLRPRPFESASERDVQPPMTCRAVGLNWAVGLKRKPRRRLVSNERPWPVHLHGASLPAALRRRSAPRLAPAPPPTRQLPGGLGWCSAERRRPRREGQGVWRPTGRNCSGREPENRSPLDACGSEC
jgi:hypothetical protein